MVTDSHLIRKLQDQRQSVVLGGGGGGVDSGLLRKRLHSRPFPGAGHLQLSFYDKVYKTYCIERRKSEILLTHDRNIRCIRSCPNLVARTANIFPVVRPLCQCHR